MQADGLIAIFCKLSTSSEIKSKIYKIGIRSCY